MKYKFKKTYILNFAFILFLTLLSGCSNENVNRNIETDNTESAEQNSVLYDDDYTLLIYMCGSSLESKNGSATDDISELLNADIPQKVNVVLETGGCERWKKYGISAERLQRYRISDHKLELLEETGLSCMGDSSTLREFIDWGTEKYPARKTSLILWDHGGGFLKGICRDEIFNSDWLTVDEFDTALRSCSFPYSFDFIGFDACLMANYETALVTSEYSNCMIASEDIEPAGGWDYRLIANSLGSGNEINTILKSFSEEHSVNEDYTLSAINLTRIENVKSVLENLINKGKTEFEKAINSADSIGIFSSDVYDIGILASLLNTDADFSDCITVVSSDAMKDLSGISICFPSDCSREMAEYIDKCPDNKYVSFLRNNFLKY
ncbi:MAG: clostripain-related cysteine peptidase [Porcipelethomonas sp.]